MVQGKCTHTEVRSGVGSRQITSAEANQLVQLFCILDLLAAILSEN